MILMIKESNPPGLRKALDIVQFYRYPPRLQVSEPAYVFTNVLSAVHFLETAEASQLNMTKEVFERSLAACSRSMERRVVREGGGAGAEGGGGEEEEGQGVGVSSVPSLLQNLTLGRGTSLPSSSFLSPSLVVGDGSSNNNKSNGANGSQQPTRSIQDIRRERMAGTAAAAKVASSASTAAVPLSLPLSPSGFLRLQDLVDQFQGQQSSSSSSSSNQGKHRQSAEAQPHLLHQSLSSQQLKQACSFLTASPQDLRVSDTSALLAEYRCLATVAGECLDLLQQQQQQQQPRL